MSIAAANSGGRITPAFAQLFHTCESNGLGSPDFVKNASASAGFTMPSLSLSACANSFKYILPVRGTAIGRAGGAEGVPVNLNLVRLGRLVSGVGLLFFLPILTTVG